MSLRIGIDTGGTFTDFVVFDESGLRVHKLRSTPDDPSRAILQGVAELSGGPPVEEGGDERGCEVVHGSTVATNALLERKGARIALVTTEGFEDVLLIGRQTRRELYDLFVTAPVPIVPAEQVFGVRERVLADGSVLVPLVETTLDELVERLREMKAEAVAVCLLHAYANPQHEAAIARRLTAEGYAVSVSHEVLSEYREFERCSTTAVNAYVTPLMASYLARLEEGLGGESLRIMQSNGGAIPAAMARRSAVQTVLSGPAGGVVGAASVAATAGFPRIITFDMGGTSTDVSLIDCALPRTTETVVGDFPVRLPLLDIHTVGAGGGSIAYVDSGGSLRVGPQSAGAAPGPACYGQGNQATVTDANLLLGRIDPARFLGGRMRIDYDRARQALTRLAVKTSLDVMALAEGIVRIANANMERAVRVVSVERGFDPRDFTLVPFGGAGGLHACEVAASLDIRTILVPANPGVLSALGMLLSDTVWDFSQTLLIASKDVDLQHVTAELDRLAATAAARLAEDGFEADAIRLERTLDVRYVGQAYEINVPFAGAALVSDGGLAFVPAFHAAHERMYGYADPARAVEIVNVRVRATGVRDKPTLRHATGASERRHAPAVAECEVYADGRIGPARVFDRARLVPGDSFAGPAIAFDDGSTTFIAAGWSGVVDRSGNLVLAAATQGL